MIDVPYYHAIGAFFDQKWAMIPEAMSRYVEVVRNWSVGIKLDKEAVENLMAERRTGRLSASSSSTFNTTPPSSDLCVSPTLLVLTATG